MITVNNLKVVFKNGHIGIDDMSFEIGNGIYGLLGENGAGSCCPGELAGRNGMRTGGVAGMPHSLFFA